MRRLLTGVLLAFAGVFAPALAWALQPMGEVYVSALRLEKNQLEPGMEVRGSFDVHNVGAALRNASYRVALMGGCVDEMPGELFDENRSAPLSLEARSKERLTFRYLLPRSFGRGPYALEVRFFSADGMPMGGASVPVQLKSQPAFLEIALARVDVGEKSYGLLEGPTLWRDPAKKASQARLVARLRAEGGAFEATPRTVLYKGLPSSHDGAPKETVGKAVRVEAGQTKDFVFALPTFDFAPGVYTGVLTFTDAEGALRASRLEFRYIIGGVTAKLVDASASPLPLKAGEQLTVSLAYRGTPADIAAPEPSTPLKARAECQAFNEHGQKVGVAQGALDLREARVALSCKAEKPARALKLVSSVRLGDGTELSRLESFHPSAEAYHAAANLLQETPSEPRQKSAGWLWQAVGGLGVLLVLVILWLAGRRRGKLPVLLLTVLLTAASSAWAWTQVSHTGGDENVVVMDLPLPPEVTSYPQGTSLNVRGLSYQFHCGNEPAWLSYEMALQPKTDAALGGTPFFRVGETPTWADKESQSVGSPNAGWDRISIADLIKYTTPGKFSFLVTNIPSTVPPGTYRIWIRASQHENFVYTITGYQEVAITPQILGSINALTPSATKVFTSGATSLGATGSFANLPKRWVLRLNYADAAGNPGGNTPRYTGVEGSWTSTGISTACPDTGLKRFYLTATNDGSEGTFLAEKYLQVFDGTFSALTPSTATTGPQTLTATGTLKDFPEGWKVIVRYGLPSGDYKYYPDPAVVTATSWSLRMNVVFSAAWNYGFQAIAVGPDGVVNSTNILGRQNISVTGAMYAPPPVASVSATATPSNQSRVWLKESSPATKTFVLP